MKKVKWELLLFIFFNYVVRRFNKWDSTPQINAFFFSSRRMLLFDDWVNLFRWILSAACCLLIWRSDTCSSLNAHAHAPVLSFSDHLFQVPEVFSGETGRASGSSHKTCSSDLQVYLYGSLYEKFSITCIQKHPNTKKKYKNQNGHDEEGLCMDYYRGL